MKIAYRLIFCALFLIPCHLFSQIDVWTAALPLTDSLTDNRDAIVAEIEFYGGWDHYIIWEKSFDTASSHIYAKKYYFEEDPVALITGEYHNTDPCVLRIRDYWFDPPDGTSFYLVYLSDRNGDYDIYYRVYSDLGWSEEYLLADTPGNESHLNSNGASGLAWDYEGSIRYTSLRKENNGPFYFTDFASVDSIGCKRPVQEPIGGFTWGDRYLAWEKMIGDSSKVMLSEWNYIQDFWDEPVMVYDTGHCTNIRFEESTFSEVYPTLSWDMTGSSGQKKLVCYDPEWPDYFFMDLDQQMDYMPAVFNIFIGVSEMWFYALLSFVKDENGQPDIFGGYQAEWNPWSYTNLSASSAPESNPKLWNGIMYYSKQDVINIWESNRNGHWQLWTSKIQVPISGSVDEKRKNEYSVMKTYPNPFSDRFTLIFYSETAGKGTLELYNTQGQRIAVISGHEIIKGSQGWEIDFGNYPGLDLTPGIYYVRLITGNESVTGKAVKYKN